jgi:hypothetical protein
MPRIWIIYINKSVKNIEHKKPSEYFLFTGEKKRFSKLYFLRRENWVFHSIYKLWDTIVQDTRTHVKYHTIMSDICGKYMPDKFNEIAEDTRRMFTKVKQQEENLSFYKMNFLSIV